MITGILIIKSVQYRRPDIRIAHAHLPFTDRHLQVVNREGKPNLSIATGVQGAICTALAELESDNPAAVPEFSSNGFGQLGRNERSLLDRLGCFSFLSAFASILPDALAGHRELPASVLQRVAGVHADAEAHA